MKGGVAEYGRLHATYWRVTGTAAEPSFKLFPSPAPTVQSAPSCLTLFSFRSFLEAVCYFSKRAPWILVSKMRTLSRQSLSATTPTRPLPLGSLSLSLLHRCHLLLGP